MNANTVIMHHVSIDERNMFHANVREFNDHLGAGGIQNHPLGDGTVPGFSTNDFTNLDRVKLDGIAPGANLYTHPNNSPGGHNWSNIQGLHQVANTGDYRHLNNIPNVFPGDIQGDARTVGGIRVTIGPSAPASPQNRRELWFDTSRRLVLTFDSGGWITNRAVFNA